MNIFKIAFLLFIFFPQFSRSQNKTTYKTKRYSIKQKTISEPKNTKPDYNTILKNVNIPSPDGNSSKSHLIKQKIKSREKFPIQNLDNNKKKSSEVSNPKLGKEFGLYYHTKTGKKRMLTGGNPTDNTLAVSNGGIVLTAINSYVYAYDLQKDTLAFEKNFISLNSMANNTNPSNYYFDPKLIYDEIKDRFILVFLKNSKPNNNKIVVCFSTTNNPNDHWNVYELPGNPLDNNRWTDFPAISLTDSSLYITGNLIVPDVSWQVGFDGSIIWEINKETGYNSTADLETSLFSDIKYDNHFIRNLHAVQGAKGKIDKPYFLSNRNFSIQNDTIFVLSLENKQDSSTDKELQIKLGISDIHYGVPPNARQLGTDTSDPTKGLQTNDGRVLAAIKIKDEIQFVSNSINTNTGLCSIYHGTIHNMDSPEITATIISDPKKDLGYPNIAWTGNEGCDIETIIGFNHTSPDDFPGISCVYYSNNKKYSDITILKNGDNYVSKIGGGYERWGDYFGLQRKFNEPGKVYSFGFFGTENRSNSGWCNEIISPDTNKLEISALHENNASFCNQIIKLNPSGGTPPYTYEWEDDLTNSTNISRGLCTNDSISVVVTDSRGCFLTKQLHSKVIFNSKETTVFPNPFSDEVVLHFSIEEDTEIDVIISDTKGVYSKSILNRMAKSGRNELKFSLSPLSKGIYFVTIMAKGQSIMNEKIVKE